MKNPMVNRNPTTEVTTARGVYRAGDTIVSYGYISQGIDYTSY